MVMLLQDSLEPLMCIQHWFLSLHDISCWCISMTEVQISFLYLRCTRQNNLCAVTCWTVIFLYANDTVFLRFSKVLVINSPYLCKCTILFSIINHGDFSPSKPIKPITPFCHRNITEIIVLSCLNLYTVFPSCEQCRSKLRLHIFATWSWSTLVAKETVVMKCALRVKNNHMHFNIF